MNSLQMLQHKFQESTSIFETETKRLWDLEIVYADACKKKECHNEEVLKLQNSLKVIPVKLPLIVIKIVLR